MADLPASEITGGSAVAIAIVYLIRTIREESRTRNGKGTNGALNKAAENMDVAAVKMGEMCRKLDTHMGSEERVLEEIRDEMREERKDRRSLMDAVVGALKRRE